MNDFWNGIKSEFPLCCILFFCDVWEPIRQSHIMFHGRPECYYWTTHVGHVQCPDCIIHSFSKVKL